MSVGLRAFTCGWFVQPKSFFIMGAGDEPIRSPVPAYLIEHPKGLALFDTGYGPKIRRLFGSAPGIEVTEQDDIAARLIEAGIDPAKINWIVNSHFHLDHCGGNVQIPNATVVVQRSEIEAARRSSDSILYDAELYDTGQPFLAVSGEHDLFGDGTVIVFPTAGHTRGHQSIKLGLPSGDVVLAGDCCYLKQSLDELQISPGDDDPEQARLTLKRLSAMRHRGTRIFYGHDGDFWQGIAQGTLLR
jgi:Zn-dependent hydrolases, including glyoxylases